MRFSTEIEALLDDARDAENDSSKFPGMTYEQGIIAALEWVTGESDDHPLDD